MTKSKYLFLSLFFLWNSIAAAAQAVQDKSGPQTVEMADAMRAEGKIYVVVAIIIIILAGMFVYLFLLDRKMKKLENIISEKERQTK
jgi:hypothetical protein